MNAPRKLAAILAADVAGYSRLTGLDEEGTLRRLHKLRRELINPACRCIASDHDGLSAESTNTVHLLRLRRIMKLVTTRRETMSSDDFPSRRRILATGAFAVTGFVLAINDGFGQQSLAPTPACHDDDEPTVEETEGPFFKPRSPQRSNLHEPGIAGRAVELSGLVLTRSCRPVPGALVDLWHADDNGVYDNKGFRLRGHVFTDNEGRYAFHTIVPGLYPGRTRHYHVKVQARGEMPGLTTQFYFPDEKRNRSDGLFRRELVMQVAETEDVLVARFDVVLALQ